MTQVAIINSNTGVCENVSLDERSISQIVLPSPYIAVDLATTPAIDWVWNTDTKEWDPFEGIGNGGIGDTWDGTKLTQPKPTVNPE